MTRNNHLPVTTNDWVQYLKSFPTAACIKIKPQNKEGTKAHSTGRILEINPKNAMAMVELKGHKRPEAIELKYCIPWQKGREMQISKGQKGQNQQNQQEQQEQQEQQKQQDEKIKNSQYVILIQNPGAKAEAFTEKRTFSNDINDAKLYLDKTRVGRARGQVARKKNLIGEPFYVTLLEAKAIMAKDKSTLNNRKKPQKPLDKDKDKIQQTPIESVTKVDDKKIDDKSKVVEEPNSEPENKFVDEDKVLEGMVLEDIVSQASRIKHLQVEKDEIKKDLKIKSKRLNEVENELQKLAAMFKIVYDS